MNTTLMRLTGPCSYFQDIEKAAQVLKNGGLVVFPTETVYGIAANAEDANAVALLYEAKNRPAEKQLAVYVADLGAIRRYVTDAPIVARRLMKRAWPGPLTIVFPESLSPPADSAPRAADGSVGLRMPDNPIALDLVRASGVAVVGTSANPSGMSAAVTADEAKDYFNGKVDVILDGGRCPVQKPSTVVKVNEESYEILREGAISVERLRKLASTAILFVCTGNTCRSAMAEALCRKALEEKLSEKLASINASVDDDYTIMSAGTDAVSGSFAAAEAMEMMRDFGCDLSKHWSRPLTPILISEMDMIFTMTAAQLADIKYLLSEYKQMGGRRSLNWNVDGYEPEVNLLHPDGKEISDPVGGSMEVYRQCAQEIERCIKNLVERL